MWRLLVTSVLTHRTRAQDMNISFASSVMWKFMRTVMVREMLTRTIIGCVIDVMSWLMIVRLRIQWNANFVLTWKEPWNEQSLRTWKGFITWLVWTGAMEFGLILTTLKRSLEGQRVNATNSHVISAGRNKVQSSNATSKTATWVSMLGVLLMQDWFLIGNRWTDNELLCGEIAKRYFVSDIMRKRWRRLSKDILNWLTIDLQSKNLVRRKEQRSKSRWDLIRIKNIAMWTMGMCMWINERSWIFRGKDQSQRDL